MSDDDNPSDPKRLDAELALTRLKQRYQLLSTVLGTCLVSIVGGWLVFAEKTQKNEQDFDAAHREFVAKFVEVAIDEDIERRQRLARYFATVTLDPAQRALWFDYAAYVDGLALGNPARIAALEAQQATASPAERARIDSEIELLRKQLGAFGAAVQLPSSDACIAEHADFAARWLCIAEGELALGVAEIAGAEANPRILDYARFVETKFEDDDIPWTSLFVAWVIAQSGVPESELPERLLQARSWLDFGDPVGEPRPGALAVFWRDSPEGMLGHVGFYVGESEGRIQVIGGNVSNAVRMHEVDRERLLGYRVYETK